MYFYLVGSHSIYSHTWHTCFGWNKKTSNWQLSSVMTSDIYSRWSEKNVCRCLQSAKRVLVFLLSVYFSILKAICSSVQKWLRFFFLRVWEGLALKVAKNLHVEPQKILQIFVAKVEGPPPPPPPAIVREPNGRCISVTLFKGGVYFDGIPFPRHPVISSADDWGVQSPPKSTVFRFLDF